jgi:hypothetical protein
MTAGHDGTAENDDPFAYLYRSEGGEEPDPAGGQPSAPRQQPYGQPRTSYNQVQRVGERRSPQQPQGGYGYPQPGHPQQGQGQDQGGQQYGGGATRQYGQQQYGQPPYEPAPDGPGSGGRRAAGQQPPAPNRKGLLIGAVAVVAAVAIGIGVAMANGPGGDGKNQAGGKQTTAPVTPTTAQTTQPTPSATASDFDSGKVDAAKLVLGGGAKQDTQVTGADAANGTYVDGLGTPGASVVWTVTVPKDGSYTFFISYGNAGQDAQLALGVNGKPRTDPVDLKNYGNYSDWEKAWSNHTYNYVDLKKGANTLSLTCVPNTNCAVNLDQVWLKQGQYKQ